MIYCAYGNILNFSHTSWIYFSWKLGHWNHWADGGKQPIKNYPFPLSHVDPHSVHQCLGPSHSPRQTTARLVHSLPHNYIIKTKIGYNWMPHIHPLNSPFPFDDNHPDLIHQSLDWPHSPSQTVSRSAQPFCHNTLCGLTDRQTYRPTDRWSRRMFRIMSAYAREWRTKTEN